MAGLSRHSQAVLVEVPGISQASRTWATGMMWASTVASMRSTHSRPWMFSTVSSRDSVWVTDPTCS